MTLLTGCLDTELNDVPLSDCPKNIGQIQKAIFWHRYKSDGTKNKFEPNLAMSPTSPALITNWSAYLAAADETKVVQSPFLSEPVSEPGAERTYGGGNATMNGVAISIGVEPTAFSAKILSYDQNTIRALKTFMKGSGVGKSNIGVILVNEAGQLIFDSNRNTVTAQSLTDAALDLWPIPIHKLFFSDLGLGGLEAVDHNMMSWQFAPNWSDNLVVVTPTDFDALEALANT